MSILIVLRRAYRYKLQLAFAVIVTAAYSANAQTFDHPSVSVTTLLSETTLYGNDESTVLVKIDGDKIAQSSRVPIDLVLVLDRSGSMANNIGKLKSAAKALIDKLDPQVDRASLITFSNGAALQTSLTNDTQLISQLIDSISANGATNIAAGVEIGIDQLASATNPQRIGIVFTDGVPFPNELAQKQKIVAQLRRASSLGIALHTVGMGTVDEILLRFIADRTGGTYSNIQSADEIDTAFSTVFDEQTNFLSTRSIQITESLHSRLAAIEDSYQSGFFPTSVDQEEFNEWEMNDLPAFYSSGQLEFPLIPEITDQNHFSFLFKIRASVCSDMDEIVTLRTAAAQVLYLNGMPAPQVLNLRANDPKQISLPRCGVHVTKTWIEDRNALEIEIINSFPLSVREMTVTDEVSDCWRVDLRSVDMFSPEGYTLLSSDRGVSWPARLMDANSRSHFVFHAVPSDRIAPQVQNPQGGSYNDLVRFTYQEPIFRTDDSDVGFSELLQNLRDFAVLSQPARALVENELGNNVVLPVATSVVPTVGSTTAFADYSVAVPVGEIRKIPQPPGKTHIADYYTGVLFAVPNESEDEIEFFVEYRDLLEIPGVATTSDYVGDSCGDYLP